MRVVVCNGVNLFVDVLWIAAVGLKKGISHIVCIAVVCEGGCVYV